MRKTIISLAALFSFSGLFGQQFQQVFSTPGVDSFTSAANAPDNGFILGGYSSGVGAGGNDIFLIRTNQYGDTLWNVTFGGTSHEGLEELVQKENGSYLFTGSSQSMNPLGNSDTFVGEFTEDGNLIWCNVLNGPLDDIPYALEVLDNGGFVLTGITNSFSTNGDYDIFVAKGNSQGEIEWYKVYGGPQYEAPRGIAADDNGNIFVWGHHSTSETMGYDGLLLKLDDAGDLLFTKEFALAQNELASAITVTANGDLLLTADTNSEGQGYNDILLIRANAEGEVIFSQTMGAQSNDHSLDITHIENDMYAITGCTSSFGAGGLDYLVSYVNEYGSVKYTSAFGGDDKDVASAAIRTENDGLVMAGSSRSFGQGFGSAYAVRLNQNFECDCHDTYGGQFMTEQLDVNFENVGLDLVAEGITTSVPTFSFVFGNPTSCETLCSSAPAEFGFAGEETANQYEHESFSRLKVAPNPSNGPVTVTVKSMEHVHTRIEVFSLEGRILQEYLIGMPGNSSQNSLVLRPLPTGIYLVRMTSGGTIETKRFVIK